MGDQSKINTWQFEASNMLWDFLFHPKNMKPWDCLTGIQVCSKEYSRILPQNHETTNKKWKHQVPMEWLFTGNVEKWCKKASLIRTEGWNIFEMFKKMTRESCNHNETTPRSCFQKQLPNCHQKWIQLVLTPYTSSLTGTGSLGLDVFLRRHSLGVVAPSSLSQLFWLPGHSHPDP